MLTMLDAIEGLVILGYTACEARQLVQRNEYQNRNRVWPTFRTMEEARDYLIGKPRTRLSAAKRESEVRAFAKQKSAPFGR